MALVAFVDLGGNTGEQSFGSGKNHFLSSTGDLRERSSALPDHAGSETRSSAGTLQNYLDVQQFSYGPIHQNQTETITEVEGGTCLSNRHFEISELYRWIFEEIFGQDYFTEVEGGTCLSTRHYEVSEVYGSILEKAFVKNYLSEGVFGNCLIVLAMAQSSSAAQSGIPLTEYRREVPPGWSGSTRLPPQELFREVEIVVQSV